MHDALRVLIVGHSKSSRDLVVPLLEDFELDFTWQYAFSDSELRAMAREFDPNIVLFADESSSNSSHASLDTLRLLSAHRPVIFIAELGASDVLQPGHAMALPRTAENRPSVLERRSEAVVCCDSNGWITHASAGACRLLGGPCDRLLVSLIGAGRNLRPHPANWLGVTDRGASVQPEHRLAFIDAWTRLPVQAHVNDLIGCLTDRSSPGCSTLALAGLNLNGLRLLTEAYGPAMGDGVLSQVRRALHPNANDCGMAARIGPDEFVLVLPEPSGPAEAAMTARGFLDSVSERRPRSAAPHDVLPEPQEMQVLADLEDAIERHALSLHYQPQFEVASGRGCGVEVLARWIRSNGDSVPPALFIPVAERGGMIRALGAWVLERACRTAAGWRGRESAGLTLSVNVSTLQIDEEFCGVLAGILRSSGFPAERLELEISESAVVANAGQIVDCVREWKHLGVRVAVNHLGTDYSSLGYLSRLKVDRLKLDRSLIHNLTFDDRSACVTHALIGLGAELGVDVIAEGVEMQAQFDMLAEFRCPRAQGYLLARPMAATQAQVALRKTWGNLARSAGRPAPAGGRTATRESCW